MFHFQDPGRSVDAGLNMVEQSPAIGLPPAHIGIHAGPGICQDGDVYGRTINLASRLASVAQACEVVVKLRSGRTVQPRGHGPSEPQGGDGPNAKLVFIPGAGHLCDT
jgi:class 3 adenylate cyclase